MVPPDEAVAPRERRWVASCRTRSLRAAAGAAGGFRNRYARDLRAAVHEYGLPAKPAAFVKGRTAAAHCRFRSDREKTSLHRPLCGTPRRALWRRDL